MEFSPRDEAIPETPVREMTQAQLAKLAGVRPAHISDMENDRRSISKEMARKLGHVLDFPYKAFL